MKRILSIMVIYTVFSIILLPAAVTLLYKAPIGNEEEQTELEEQWNIPEALPTEDGAILPESKGAENVPLEEYVKGVVGAEMPALFPIEALKAQAVAARTYAVREILDAGGSFDAINPEEIGQAYIAQEERKEKWGADFEEYEKKISQAVTETTGQILYYEKEPILAVFHAESGGYTEDSANIWGKELPYLKSVDSLEDEQAPNFLSTVELSTEEVITKLQKSFPDLKLTQGSLLEQMQVAERTEAGYIKTIQVGNKILTGRQMREALGLRSANFTIRQEGGALYFTTKGYGHGAGMSQYGAKFMAEDGKPYEEILKHYYQGVEIGPMNSI